MDFFDAIDGFGDEYVEMGCDGCDALFGAVTEEEYKEWRKTLHLCSHCTPECCATDRLIEVGGYVAIVRQRVEDDLQAHIPVSDDVLEYIENHK